MFQLDEKHQILFRDLETQLAAAETEQKALNEARVGNTTRPAQKSVRSRKRRREPVEVEPLNIFIEPFVPPDPVFSPLPLQAPRRLHLQVAGDHVETWWQQVEGAAVYEFWVCPQAFDAPEPPADRMFIGADHALLFPLTNIRQPGYYHFRVRAVDGTGRPGTWSSDQVLPFHIPALELDVIPGLNSGELTLHWQPVECARHYEIQMDQRLVYSSDEPSKYLENLPLGLHDFKVRPVFAGGSAEWAELPFIQFRLEPPLEITPQEVSIFKTRDGYLLHWCCPADAPVDSFVILDPDHDQRVFGQVLFQASEKSWFGSFFNSLKAYRWPIPPALEVEGQRFAVRAVKGKLTGPLSEIKTVPHVARPMPAKVPKHEIECSVGDVDWVLRDFLRKKQLYGKLSEQKLEIYDDASHLRQYSIYHRPVLQAMNLQTRTDYRLSLTLTNGQLWQVEIIFNPKTYKYTLTFQGMSDA